MNQKAALKVLLKVNGELGCSWTANVKSRPGRYAIWLALYNARKFLIEEGHIEEDDLAIIILPDGIKIENRE